MRIKKFIIMKCHKFILFLFTLFMKNYKYHVAALSEEVVEGNLIDINFYENLQEDYKTFWDLEMSEDIKQQIDQLINDFHGTQNAGEQDHWKNTGKVKRSAKKEEYVIGNFVFDGFEPRGTVPINFAQDLCIFSVNGTTMAAALSSNGPNILQSINETVVTFFKREKSIFIKMYSHQVARAKSMDCLSMGNVAFVAIASEILSISDYQNNESPVFKIQSNNFQVVHISRIRYQRSVRLWSYGNDVFLMQSFYNDKNFPTIAGQFLCPIYKWSKQNHFDLVDELPCYNTVQFEPFTIASDWYLAVANSQDEENNPDTFSFIYKYDLTLKKLILYQKFRTKGIVDLKYFLFNHGNIREHFLFAANRFERNNKGHLTAKANTIIYKFINGKFLPFQHIPLESINKLLPVAGPNKNEFLLLAHCENSSVQIFEYDGWQFTLLSIQMNEAFVSEVSSMRFYKLKDYSLISIANPRLTDEKVNLFEPKYIIREKKDLYTEIFEWCEKSIETLQNNEIDELISVIDGLPKINDTTIKLKGGIKFTNVDIGNLVTKTMSLASGIIDDRLAEQLNEAFQIIKNLEDRLARISEKISTSMKKNDSIVIDGDIHLAHIELNEGHVEHLQAVMMNGHRTSEIFDSSFRNITEDDVLKLDDLDVENMSAVFINGLPSETLLHSNTDMRAMNLTCKNVTIRNDIFVRNTIDNIVFDEHNILLTDTDQVLKGSINFQRISANNLSANNISSIDANDLLKILNKLKEKSITYRSTSLNAMNLIVKGFTNDVDLATINQFALKNNGDQFISDGINFGQITAKRIITEKLCSHKNISDAVLITNGKFVLNSDIQFENDVKIDNLFVQERINNIKVIEGQLDILLRDSDKIQTITGNKIFESVKLQEPITLQGKISSPILDKMNPISTINEDLVLGGNFTITGPVRIKRRLSSFNIFGEKKILNAKNLIEHGLSTDLFNTNVKLQFHQPIKVNNFVTTSINGLNPKNFIRTDTDEIQIVTGHKVFKSNLIIHDGLCDAAEINNVNLKQLNETILKKTGDQNIQGNIHFRKISAYRLATNKSNFSGHQLENFLNAEFDQFISGNVTIKGSISIKNKLEVNKLTTSNLLIYKRNLDEIIMDTPLKESDLIVTGDKYFKGGLTLDRIAIKGTVSGIDFGQFFNEDHQFIHSEMILKGPLTFSNEMQVNNLNFSGTLNGIPSYEFGNCWLLYEHDQTFTAPQVFSNVYAKNGINLNGKINGHNLGFLYVNSYFINQPETLPEVHFESGFVSFDSITVTRFVSGLRFPEDLIFTQSQQNQEVATIKITNNVVIENQLKIIESINNVKVNDLLDFYIEKSDETSKQLVVHGNARFNVEPAIKYLNGIDIDYLYANAWMQYSNLEQTGKITIENAYFENDTVVAGLVNGISLNYLAENYVSLSRSQSIVANLEFLHEVKFSSLLKSRSLLTSGFFKSPVSGNEININDFNDYVFKKNVNQNITGNWVFWEVFVEGNVNIKVNGLNLVNDVLRYDVQFNNITAPKIFKNLFIDNLQCLRRCTIQNVDVTEWHSRSVQLNGNYTIQGTTTINSPIIHTNIEVFGLVNNLIFDDKNILTKSTEQFISGNVFIDNKSLEEYKIHQLTFDAINTDYINGKSMQKFFTNLFKSDDYKTNSDFVKGQLKFEKPLIVDNLKCYGQLFGVNISNFETELTVPHLIKQQELGLKNLYQVGEQLIQDQTKKSFYLSHYDVRQYLEGPVSIVPIEININGKIFQHIALLNETRNNKTVEFYTLDSNHEKFIISTEILPLYDMKHLIINIGTLTIYSNDYLFVELYSAYYKSYIQVLFYFIANKFQVVYERPAGISQKMAVLHLNEKRDCLATYSSQGENILIECVFFENGIMNVLPYQEIKIPAVRQITALQENLLALVTSRKGVLRSLELWIHNDKTKWQHHQTLQVINPTHTSSIFFEGNLYLAVCSEQTKSSNHLGSVEIYRSIGSYHFEHFQRVLIKLPIHLEFSILPTSELVLYVLTSNPVQPLIIYQYAGISGFKEYVISSIPCGNNVAVVKVKELQKEFISVVASNEALIIEAVMKQI